VHSIQKAAATFGRRWIAAMARSALRRDAADRSMAAGFVNSPGAQRGLKPRKKRRQWQARRRCSPSTCSWLRARFNERRFAGPASTECRGRRSERADARSHRAHNRSGTRTGRPALAEEGVVVNERQSRAPRLGWLHLRDRQRCRRHCRSATRTPVFRSGPGWVSGAASDGDRRIGSRPAGWREPARHRARHGP
jgi:hypothetical protein